MKCIPQCGFSQKPDNLIILQKHMHACSLTGALRHFDVEAGVVWRDGELTVATVVYDDETVISGRPTIEPAPKRAAAPKKTATAKKKTAAKK